MDAWPKIVALLRVLYPFPNFGDAAARVKWELGIVPPADDLVFGLIGQLKAAGEATISIPGDAVISVYDRGEGVFAMSDDHQDLLCAAAATELAAPGAPPEANGQLLAFLKEKALPFFLQYVLPYLLKASPAPVV